MIAQFLHHIFSDGILLCCTSAMMILAGIDLASLFGRRFGFLRWREMSFATSIVSIGLFATFCGVLMGLYGFDSKDISASVPRLLEGLRFAFAGSVLGMFLSLTLSILHKFFGSGADEELVLESIDQKIGTLVATMQSPQELVKQFTEMKTFLRDHLQKIDVSLDGALKELSRGATQEVVQALEGIIREFNNNLTQQFGDNFKELNEACVQLVDWQAKYRQHVEKSERSLTTLLASIEQSCVAAEQITESNAKTQKVCQEVADLVKTYDLQVKTLETHLRSCAQLGEQAGKFLSHTQSAITRSADSMNDFSGVITTSVGKQSEALARLTKDIDEQLPKALGELERVLTEITNRFASDYRSLFQYISDKR